MNERADHVLNEERPVSLFRPDSDALGKIHSMSFKDGILIDCRVIVPDYFSGLRWLMKHYED